jgi:hypothetical protein
LKLVFDRVFIGNNIWGATWAFHTFQPRARIDFDFETRAFWFDVCSIQSTCRLDNRNYVKEEHFRIFVLLFMKKQGTTNVRDVLSRRTSPR